MENIVCVTPFSAAFISHPLRGNRTNTQKHLKWSPPYWWKQETEPQMTSQISFSLGVLRGAIGYSSPSSPADQYAESGHYAAFLKSVHNRYVIIFHLLAVFNTLIIISPPWAERKRLPPPYQNLIFFQRTSLSSCGGMCPWLFFCFFPLKCVNILSYPS